MGENKMLGFFVKSLVGAAVEAGLDGLERVGDAVIDPVSNYNHRRTESKKLWFGIDKKAHHQLIAGNAKLLNDTVLHNNLLGVKQLYNGYHLIFNEIVEPFQQQNIDTWFEIACEIHSNKIFVPVHHYSEDASCTTALALPAPTEQQSTETTQQGINPRFKHVQDILSAYNIAASIVDIDEGKTIDRITVRPELGYKIESAGKVTKDMARDLGLEEGSEPIIIPNIGDGLAAIDMPTKNRQFVFVHDLIDSSEWHEFCRTAELPMLFGEKLDGTSLFIDYASTPQGMFSGTTGSGKSVGTNTNILSLMSARSPEQVKFWMLDPKMVELSLYNDSPFLIDPVATEFEDMVLTLQKAVDEMESRYQLFATNRVKNLQGYNRKMQKEGSPELHSIVVVHEEIADAVTCTIKMEIDEKDKPIGKEIERLLMRLGQKARAAGMHLYCITQTPNSEILGQTLRSNLPFRVAFQVLNASQSSTALAVPGARAERLTGKGDAMCTGGAIGQNVVRFQSAFMPDEDFELWLESVNAKYSD